MIPSIKDYIYVGIIVTMVGSAWAVVDSWHYEPIRLLMEERASLEIQLEVTGSLLNVCEHNLSKQLLEGFIDAVGGHNEDISISLDNLST